jgi:hypothetical protein
MSARNKIIDVFDVCGGIAGASVILATALLLVSAPGSSHKLLQLIIALLLLAFGLMLTVRRQLKRTRIVIGAIFLVLFLLSLIAAIFLPNLHRFA